MAMKKKPKKHRDTNTIKFGNHLIFDGYGCDPKKLGDESVCFEVLNKIVEIADMKKLHEPIIVKAGSNEALGGKDPGGYSCFIMIQESHISLHSFTKRGFVTIDVYSCKEFDSQPLIKYLKKAFKAKDSDVLKIDRGLKYPAENIY
jgi:S-adenosylmethionine decarboxylase